MTWVIKQLSHYIHGTVKNLLNYNCTANGVHSTCTKEEDIGGLVLLYRNLVRQKG